MSYPNVWLHVLNGISDLIQITKSADEPTATPPAKVAF